MLNYLAELGLHTEAILPSSPSNASDFLQTLKQL